MDTLRVLGVLTISLTLLLSTKILSQPLMDNGNHQCSDFHTDMKLDKMKTLLSDLEDHLEKNTLQLNAVQADRKSIYDSYLDLMKMYSTGVTPDGNLLYCFENCQINFKM